MSPEASMNDDALTFFLVEPSSDVLEDPQVSLRGVLSHLRLRSLTEPDLKGLLSQTVSTCSKSSDAKQTLSHAAASIMLSKPQALSPALTPGGVFIGVSLGGRSPMTSADNIEALLEVLTARGYQDTTFLVADDIARFNYHVFDTCSLASGAALKGARSEGDGLCDLIHSVAALCPYMNVRVCRWRDISTAELAKMVDVLERAYVEVPELNELFTGMALQFYRYRRGDRKPKPSQLKSLVSYFLNELPTISHGIQVDGAWITTVIYPSVAGADPAVAAANPAAAGHIATTDGPAGNTAESPSVGIGAIWDMLSKMKSASESCRKVFAELDAIAGYSSDGLGTVAIDALYPKPQLAKSASTSDLLVL